MIVLYVLVPLAIGLASLALYGFIWSVKNDQYDDVQTPAVRILWDDEA